MLYSPNDPLFHSKTGKAIVPVRALKNFENEISLDYIFFNSTGKFPHKYCIQGFVCASDVVDYMTSKDKPGKMLLVLVKMNEKDLLIFSLSDSKRTFYKSLSSASQILGSIKMSLTMCDRIKLILNSFVCPFLKGKVQVLILLEGG